MSDTGRVRWTPLSRQKGGVYDNSRPHRLGAALNSHWCRHRDIAGWSAPCPPRCFEFAPGCRWGGVGRLFCAYYLVISRCPAVESLLAFVSPRNSPTTFRSTIWLRSSAAHTSRSAARPSPNGPNSGVGSGLITGPCLRCHEGQGP